MSKKKLIRSHYEPRIRPGRENFDILDWADPASQQVRFQVLVENVPLAGKTLLDIGCGLGDLWAFLKERGIGVRYTGIDLLDKMVQEARRRHSDGEFLCGDLFAEGEGGRGPSGLFADLCQVAGPGRAGRSGDAMRSAASLLTGEGPLFDVVFCSGVFNLDLGNNREFLPVALARMFQLAREHVVFNLLHERTVNRYGHCAYYDPREVCEMLRAFPCTFRVLDHYLHNDFTVVCAKRP